MRESLGRRRSAKPIGAMKVKATFAGPREEGAGHLLVTVPALPGRLIPHREGRRTQSTHVGTRKMVNYAWPGRSQGKP